MCSKRKARSFFERRAVLSQKVLDHGRALMTPLLEQIKDGGRNDPHKAQFKKPIDMFELAIDLEPENTEAEEELEKMRDVLEVPEEEPRPTPNHDDPYDVIIVGAGASGVGMGLMLTKVFNLDPQRVLLIERGEKVGESFRSLAAARMARSHHLSTTRVGQTPLISTRLPMGLRQHIRCRQSIRQGRNMLLTYTSWLIKGNSMSRVRTEVTALRPRRRGGHS